MGKVFEQHHTAGVYSEDAGSASFHLARNSVCNVSKSRDGGRQGHNGTIGEGNEEGRMTDR